MHLLAALLGIALAVFTLVEVNYPFLSTHGQLSMFGGLGLVLCFWHKPTFWKGERRAWTQWMDMGLVGLACLVFGYIFIQSEPLFDGLWIDGVSLGNRAGVEHAMDIAAGIVGLFLVLEGARRSVGWALPLLSLIFLMYAFIGPELPSWFFPHRGYGLGRVTSQTFLHSQGVFGIALRVMFTYVFLFILFGALLEATGTTEVIINWTRRMFAGSRGAPAKVAVLSSGLMGSLSGSAVANTATTGTFTIPLMRSSGFKPETAAAIEAAASSGGALVPPVMGAGAYMMLELIDPPVTFLEIIRAAIIPAALYYFAILMTVHFWSGKINAQSETQQAEKPALFALHLSVFLGALLVLVALLIAGRSPFRAVSVAMLFLILIAAVHPETRLSWHKLYTCLQRTAVNAIPLIAAAACVGVIIGVVTLTGLGTKLPQVLIPLGQSNLFLALLMIMVTSLILGMGLPSAVCYLLLATFVGSVIKTLGVPPLAGHLFIFYFGLMSMVTPPVALAAFAAASIAGSGLMKTSMLAFRFSLVGFVLPFLFIYQPELLMINAHGTMASIGEIAGAVLWAALGCVTLSAALAGYWNRNLNTLSRAGLVLLSALFFIPMGPWLHPAIATHWTDLIGLVGFVFFWWTQRERLGGT
ncbi:MAG: TRAP transporter fused permease subunit [Acidobacteria bacterium]|nr:TRAP transporter fused permease subunit [Acidobacteriota bacterium]